MINKVSQETKDAIKRKSAYSLPDRPSDQGMKPEEIKRAFYQPIVDSANSVLSEVDRVVYETNNEFQNLPKKLPADGGNSDTVNGHKVYSDVPADAKFTDTIYSDATSSKSGLMSASDKVALANIKSKDIPKNYYNLGAYDTYVSNGDGTGTVTRNTGYIVLNGSENFGKWNTNTPDKYRYHLSTEYPITEEQTNATIFNVCNWKSTTDDGTFLCTEGVAFDTGGGIDIYNNDYKNDLDGFKQWLSRKPINIQYKTANSYTETVIENQPLITLDQDGSQWLREEWEKGLNLCPVKEISTGVIARLIEALPEGTYTICLNDSSPSSGAEYILYANGVPILDGVSTSTSHTFTITETSLITIYCNGVGGTTSIMLNKGSHAYPYQPYEGEIVHEKDLSGIQLFPENVNPAETRGGDWEDLGTITVGSTTLHAYQKLN